MFVGMIFCCCDGFCPLYFLAKFNSLISSDGKFSLGNNHISAKSMLALSLDNVVGGSFLLNVSPFSENPPLFKTNLYIYIYTFSSAICCQAHFPICTSESTNVLLAVEECYTSF